MFKSDILSRAEIQFLLERNNANPDLGRPVYMKAYEGRGSCNSTDDLLRVLRRANLGPTLTHATWTKQLNSKKFRVNQLRSNKARVVMRPVHIRKGIQSYWTELELNAKHR